MSSSSSADRSAVPQSVLTQHLDELRKVQNPDGGWGFRPGKKSWLEPTFYASLALHGEPAADRAWALLREWQAPDGGWCPSGDVDLPGWGTALMVTLAQVRGEIDEPFRKGMGWLLAEEGNENGLFTRVLSMLHLVDFERDLSQRGWPWKEDTAAWVEPTAHALVALKKARSLVAAGRVQNGDRVAERIGLGEGKLLDVQCEEGGWNYGTREVLGELVPPWPETTALGLLGLQAHRGVDKSLDFAEASLNDSATPLARAWLTIVLRLWGRTVFGAAEPRPSPDLAITALQALAADGGNYQLLSTEVSA